MVYFSLMPHIYAAHSNGAIIILDSKKDDYLSLVDESAHYFTLIVTNALQYNTRTEHYTIATTPATDPTIISTIDTEELNEWIVLFLEQEFIVQTDIPASRAIAPEPTEYGGLANYQWDTKTSWQPFKRTAKWHIFKSFIQLAKVHRILKKQGIGGVLTALNQLPLPTIITPPLLHIKELADSIDAASLLYPKKTFCLAWASTFTLLARQRGWNCKLVIGVQSAPFYAHAWAEINHTVIHDDPQIARVLSIILKF